MAKNWFATLFRRNFQVTLRTRRRLVRQWWRNCMPLIERLETRLAPATFIWTGASQASRNWSDPNNWTTGGVPGAPAPSATGTDDLIFPATLASGASFLSINDFVSGSQFRSMTLQGGGYTLTLPAPGAATFAVTNGITDTGTNEF